MDAYSPAPVVTPAMHECILREVIEPTLRGMAAEGHPFDRVTAEWDPHAALGVVLVADGYPGDYRKGDAITGLPTHEEEGIKLFHAGTATKDGRIVTNGGRVLCATVLGATVQKAQRRACELVRRIDWDGMYYRSDIGYQAIRRGQHKG